MDTHYSGYTLTLLVYVLQSSSSLQDKLKTDRTVTEIAVDQQTKAHDQTFEGVPDSGCPLVPAGQPRPYLVNFWLNFAKSP